MAVDQAKRQAIADHSKDEIDSKAEVPSERVEREEARFAGENLSVKHFGGVRQKDEHYGQEVALDDPAKRVLPEHFAVHPLKPAEHRHAGMPKTVMRLGHSAVDVEEIERSSNNEPGSHHAQRCPVRLVKTFGKDRKKPKARADEGQRTGAAHP